jgi:hypothetical protein
VQLCQSEEDGREKCADYLPSKGPKKYGSVTVRTTENTKRLVANPSVLRTTLEVSRGNDKFDVSHFLLPILASTPN